MIIDKSQYREMSLCFPIAKIQHGKREVKYLGDFFYIYFMYPLKIVPPKKVDVLFNGKQRFLPRKTMSYTSKLNSFFQVSKIGSSSL